MNLLTLKSGFFIHCKTDRESHQKHLEQSGNFKALKATFKSLEVAKAATSSFLAMAHDD